MTTNEIKVKEQELLETLLNKAIIEPNHDNIQLWISVKWAVKDTCSALRVESNPE